MKCSRQPRFDITVLGTPASEHEEPIGVFCQDKEGTWLPIGRGTMREERSSNGIGFKFKTWCVEDTDVMFREAKPGWWCAAAGWRQGCRRRRG